MTNECIDMQACDHIKSALWDDVKCIGMWAVFDRK